MAQQQQQRQQQHPAHAGWGPSNSPWSAAASSSTRHRPGKLLLGDIQSLQQQRGQQQGPVQRWSPRHPAAAANELATLALATDSSSSTENESVQCLLPQQQQQQFGEPELTHSSALQSHHQQQQLGGPFWKEPAHKQQQQQRAACPSDPAPQHHTPPKVVAFRPGGVYGPQFASATLSGGGSGGGSSGSGSDSPSALKAVGRVFGNGEVCKLLGFIGAQLLMHFASIQHGMHQLHARQQQQQQQQHDGQHSSEQQQGPGFGGWRLRMPWQRQDVEGGTGADGHGGHGGSQGAGSAAWQAGEAAKQWVVRGVAAEKAIQLREALACYTNAVMLEPVNREYLCRLAKQWSDLTYEEGATVEQIQEVNSKAMEYAERVISMAPKAPDGYMAACVSKGRLALFSDNKTKVRLAKEAQEAARTAVALDPSNDLAHHLMGRWHFEMAQINFVLRQLIRIVYGASLNPGTFDEALAEFQQAVALNPDKLIHRVELGRTHLRLGHKRDAYAHLTASMGLEVEDVNAKLQKEDAELLLAKLQAELKGRTELPASWGGFTAPGIAHADAVSDSSKSSSSSSSCKVEEVDDSSSSSGSVAGGAGGAAA